MTPLRFSALRQMAKSPAHYAAHILQEPITTSAMDIGTAADLLILGGRPVLAYPGPVRRGKEWEAFREANREAAIVTKTELVIADGIASAVAACPDAVRLLDGVRQNTLYWTMNGRECRGTPDVIGEGYIADLKTGQTSDPRRFGWKVKQLAYHAAAAWYLHGCRFSDGFIGPSLMLGAAPTAAFIVAVEQDPPHVVTVFQFTDHALELGERLWRTWFELLQVCEASESFPPYSQSIVDLDILDDEDIDIGAAVELVSTTE